MCFGSAEQAERIGDAILRDTRYLVMIVDGNRETLISSKSAEIVNTSMAPHDTKCLGKAGQRIDDSILREADNRSGLIHNACGTIKTPRESAQVLEFSISPQESMLCEFRRAEKWVRIEHVGVRNGGKCAFR